MVTADELKAKGNAAFSAGNYEEAIEHFTNAIDMDGTNHVFYSNRSAAFAAQSQFNQALDDAEKVISIKPDWPKGYSRKGKALHGLGRIEDAAECYREGLKHDSSNAALNEGLRQVEGELKSQSANVMNQLVAGFMDPNFLTRLAVDPRTMAFAKQPDFIEKVKEIQADPNKLQTHLSDQRIMSAVQVSMQPMMPPSANARGAATNDASVAPSKVVPPPDATATASSAHVPDAPAKTVPEPVPEPEMTPEEKAEKANKEKAAATKAEGNALYKKKLFAEALVKYDEAIELDPKEMTFWLNKASVYLEMGETDKSVECASKAVDVGRSVRAEYKQIAKAYMRMGNAYRKAERFDDAIEAYTKSLTENYSDEANKRNKECKKLKVEAEAKAYLDDDKAAEAKERGNDKFRAGDYAEAIKDYEDSLRRKPDNAPVYSNMAACLAKLGHFPAAVEKCDKCIELDPTFVKAYTRKGGFQFYLKEYHKAIKSYTKALELDPNCAEAKDGLYRTRVAMQNSQGDEERAKHAMADPEIQAIMTDPVIQQVLNDLQNDPQAAQKHLANAEIASKIQTLIDAGILRTG